MKKIHWGVVLAGVAVGLAALILTAMGNPAKEVIEERSWYYFPHVFTEDYAAGWYDDVEAMQDKYDTFYAGEIMSFGDMDETVEYSRELVERFFK